LFGICQTVKTDEDALVEGCGFLGAKGWERERQRIKYWQIRLFENEVVGD
jgi:hypothetical protein